MHKGIRHTRKNKSRKNKSHKYRGGMGATEYVAGMYGDLNQQTAGLNQHMQLSTIQHGSAVAPQSGGKGRKGRRSFRVPQNGPSRLAGGNYLPLQPAEYGGQVGALSDGQKGGYITELLERAVVPFGLMALRNYAGKFSKKNRKYKK
jgi:hypothetical protein